MAKTSLKRIAIIGSANKERNGADHEWQYLPPLANEDVVLEACRDLGAALSLAGWDIVVYAGESLYAEHGFIEPPVVHGYAGHKRVRPDSVHVPYSRRFPTPEFPEQRDHPEAFEIRVDLSHEWEPSFYRSLAEVDAALILGGGESAYLAGLVCLGRRIPVLAVAAFGAGGSRVHRAMVDAAVPLDIEDLELLGRSDWTPQSAQGLVESLATQQDALDQESDELFAIQRGRQRSQSAWVALSLFLVAAMLVPTALLVKDPSTWPELALLFVVPIVSGASGGTIRTLLPRSQELEISTIGSSALGAVAGGVSGMLYVISQLISSTETSLGSLTTRQYQTWVLFALVIGFVAGLALDSVYQRLVNAGAAQEIGL